MNSKTGETEILDFTNGGKCSGRGNFCSNFLLMTETEIKRLRKYVKDNNIKPTIRGVLETKVMDCICPLLSTENTCKVYAVRPKICKVFICNREAKMSDFAGNEVRDFELTNVRKVIFGGVKQ